MIDLRNLLLTAAAGFAAALPAHGQEPAAPAKPPAAAKPAPAKSVDQLVEALGSESYRARLDAERSLREMGDAAVPALKQAAEHSDDAEVQWRARRVLRQIERGGHAADLQKRGEAEPDTSGQSPQDRQPPVALRRRAGEPDAVRDQFESLFERFERDFGIDIPRARFFDDGFFRDLQEQMKAGASRSQGLSMQIGPDGKVRVEVQEKGEDGKTDTKVYEAPDMESFQQKYPGVLHRNGLGMGLIPGGAMRGWSFDLGEVPQLRTLPRRPAIQGLPPTIDAQPMATPPAGKRLGIAIRSEIPAGVREYLELGEGVGLMVESVSDGSLAQALGLQKDDIVVKIGDRSIGSPQDVQDALGPIKKGESVEVHFLRKGSKQTAKAAKTEDAEVEKPKSDRLQPRGARSDESIR